MFGGDPEVVNAALIKNEVFHREEIMASSSKDAARQQRKPRPGF